MIILVAGAAGALGRHVVAEAVGRGHEVRALVHRSPLTNALPSVDVYRANALHAHQLHEACDGVDAVISAMGASVLPDFTKGRKSYPAVDIKTNLNLLAAARSAGVRRFVYVSVACHRTLHRLTYVRAHEAVVGALATTSGMEHVVIRPTGFFSAFGAILPMALKGRIPIIGDGTAKTNPIHDGEVASVCIDALDGSEPEIELGGPEVFTRRQIVDEAFRAVGRPVKTMPLPPPIARLMALAMFPINPRIAHLMQFVTAVSTSDVLAPAHGSMRLLEYFAIRASKTASC